MINELRSFLPADVRFLEYGGGQVIISAGPGFSSAGPRSWYEAQLLRYDGDRIVDREIIEVDSPPFHLSESEIAKLMGDKIRDALRNMESRR